MCDWRWPFEFVVRTPKSVDRLADGVRNEFTGLVSTAAARVWPRPSESTNCYPSYRRTIDRNSMNDTMPDRLRIDWLLSDGALHRNVMRGCCNDTVGERLDERSIMITQFERLNLWGPVFAATARMREAFLFVRT